MSDGDGLVNVSGPEEFVLPPQLEWLGSVIYPSFRCCKIPMEYKEIRPVHLTLIELPHTRSRSQWQRAQGSPTNSHMSSRAEGSGLFFVRDRAVQSAWRFDADANK